MRSAFDIEMRCAGLYELNEGDRAALERRADDVRDARFATDEQIFCSALRSISPKMKVRYAETARRELEEIVDDIDRRNPKAATAVVARIEQVVDWLVDFPR